MTISLPFVHAVPASPLARLDPDQLVVAQHVGGPLCVLASAGSGKSASLCARVWNLVTHHGVAAPRVLLVTFTKNAAEELRARIGAMLPGSNTATVLTFHAFSRAFLAREATDFAAWHPDEVADADWHYAQYLREACGRKTPKKLFGDKHLEWSHANLDALRGFVELAKAAGMPPWSDAARALAERRMGADPEGRDPARTNDAYALAEKKRIAARRMTFADWMVECARRLRGDPATRARWQAAFDHVMVDEAQDMSRVQLAIAMSLAEEHRNLIMIGDGKQAIYSFRGAAPEVFASFPETWQAPVATISHNYRSAVAIVANGNAASDFVPGDHVPMIATRETPGLVAARGFTDARAEADAIADHILARRAAGARWLDHAVLVRVRSAARACEDAFAKRGLPARLMGGGSFYGRRDPRALLAYLRVAGCVAGEEHLADTLKAPFRMLPAPYIQALAQELAGTPTEGWDAAVAACARGERARDWCIQQGSQWLRAVRSVQHGLQLCESPKTLLTRVLSATGYRAWVAKESGAEETDDDRLDDIAELLSAAEIFPDAAALCAHADRAIKSATRKAKFQEDVIRIATIHAVKGLEFACVFLAGARQGVMPHIRGEYAEEARLYYVAVTRARDELHISWSKGAPSEFFDPAVPIAPQLDPGSVAFLQLDAGDKPF